MNENIPQQPSDRQHDELPRRELLILAAALVLTGCSTEDSEPVDTTSEAPNQNTATAEARKGREYPIHTEIMATVFYLGEEASDDNAGISNVPTSWDSNSIRRFGGIDSPDQSRSFVPKHNTYYFALPADEFDEKGPLEGAHESSPWSGEELPEGASLFKGRWIKVSSGDMEIYAQWVDCGPSDDPNGNQDYNYVFGDSDQRPINTFGLRAGLDLSPSAAKDLGFGVDEGGINVSWQFVDGIDVPEGPWSKYPAIDNRTHWD
jgi:hypothetical protein